MTVQSDLVAGARLLTENATLRGQLDAAQQAARQSAHAAQILGNQIRIAAGYLLTVPDGTDLDDVRRTAYGLLTGTTREPGRDTS